MNERYRVFGHDGQFFVVDMESGLVAVEPTDRDAAERLAAELNRQARDDD